MKVNESESKQRHNYNKFAVIVPFSKPGDSLKVVREKNNCKNNIIITVPHSCLGMILELLSYKFCHCRKNIRLHNSRICFKLFQYTNNEENKALYQNSTPLTVIPPSSLLSIMRKL